MKTIPGYIGRDHWEWFGAPGHFISGRYCRFHLCTLVGDYLISTIGEYVPPEITAKGRVDEGKWLEEHWPGEDVGLGKYETMAFTAGDRCKEPGCNCGQPTIGSAEELSVEWTADRGKARAAHMAMCEKYAILDAVCPECGSGDLGLAPETYGERFLQCDSCGWSEAEL